jgi:hypothetical protein
MVSFIRRGSTDLSGPPPTPKLGSPEKKSSPESFVPPAPVQAVSPVFNQQQQPQQPEKAEKMTSVSERPPTHTKPSPRVNEEPESVVSESLSIKVCSWHCRACRLCSCMLAAGMHNCVYALQYAAAS